MLSVYDLYCTRKKDNKRNQETFDSILNKCCVVIKKANNLGENMCIYEIPTFILGKPTYDLNNCVRYIIKKLKKNDFNIMLVSNNIILITWVFSQYKNNNKSHINSYDLLIN